MGYRKIGSRPFNYHRKHESDSEERGEYHYVLPDGRRGTYHGTKKGFNRFKAQYKNQVRTY